MGDAVGALMIVVAALVGFIFLVFFAINETEEDARWEGRCEALHAKVAVIDHDHKVCIRNGEVVKP